MLKSISNFLKTGRLVGDGADSGEAGHDPEDLQLAVAVLLIEAAVLEENYSAAERDLIEDLLAKRFDLADEQRSSLMELATQTQSDSVELHRFTNVVKDNYGLQERAEIIEMLWEVVYADGVVHDYEAYLLRKIAGLIHVSDRTRGDLQKRVRARLGLDP